MATKTTRAKTRTTVTAVFVELLSSRFADGSAPSPAAAVPRGGAAGGPGGFGYVGSAATESVERERMSNPRTTDRADKDQPDRVELMRDALVALLAVIVATTESRGAGADGGGGGALTVTEALAS